MHDEMRIRGAWDQIKKIPRRMMVLFAILGIAIVALIIPKAQEKDDWPLYRLNEIKSGKTPPVLYLSGKFNETWKPRPGSPKPKGGDFEMYIRGTNYYYLKCWHGNPTNRPGPIVGVLSQFLPFVGRGYSGWFQVQIAVDDFSWHMGRRWGRFGSQGGGGSGGDLVPGRRLWNQAGFIGATEEGQVNKEWYATETFRNLKSIGDFKIPRVIEFDRGDYSQTFQIKKCEFRDTPEPDWFVARKMEYYREPKERPETTATNSPTAK